MLEFASTRRRPKRRRVSDELSPSAQFGIGRGNVKTLSLFPWREWLYPAVCAGCGQPGDLVCAECRRTVPRLPALACPTCLHEMAPDGTCAHCSASPNGLTGLRAVGRYVTPHEGEPHSPFTDIIHAFKYDGLHALAGPLGDWLAATLAAWPTPATVVVPLPSHPTRVAERGYDHTALLAERVAHGLGRPYVAHWLYRIRYTPSHAAGKLSPEERRANVAGAFAARPLPPGQHVLLVDDVYTTGATMAECARTLREAGAASVWGAVLGCVAH